QARLRQFLHAMTGLSMGAAAAIAEKFPWDRYHTVIDIGAAEGCVPAQLTLRHPHLTGGGFDLPAAGPAFEDYVASHGLTSRLRFYPGDFFTDPLPRADVLVMGHILHDWSLEQKLTLLRKAHQALPDGGALIVYDAIIDDDRTTNIFGLLMSLNMLIETPAGFDYTAADCRSWMADIGFRDTYAEPLPGPTRWSWASSKPRSRSPAPARPTTAAAEVDRRKPRVVVSPSLPSPSAPRCCFSTQFRVVPPSVTCVNSSTRAPETLPRSDLAPRPAMIYKAPSSAMSRQEVSWRRDVGDPRRGYRTKGAVAGYHQALQRSRIGPAAHLALHRAVRCRQAPEVIVMNDRKGLASRKVAVLGPIPRDQIVTHAGERFDKYGTVIYTAAALSALLDPGDTIVPISHVRRQDEGPIKQILGSFPNIDISGITSSADQGDVVELRYIDQNRRVERQTSFMNPILPADLDKVLDADVFVCVPITDYEVGPLTLR